MAGPGKNAFNTKNLRAQDRNDSEKLVSAFHVDSGGRRVCGTDSPVALANPGLPRHVFLTIPRGRPSIPARRIAPAKDNLPPVTDFTATPPRGQLGSVPTGCITRPVTRVRVSAHDRAGQSVCIPSSVACASSSIRRISLVPGLFVSSGKRVENENETGTQIATYDNSHNFMLEYPRSQGLKGGAQAASHHKLSAQLRKKSMVNEVVHVWLLQHWSLVTTEYGPATKQNAALSNIAKWSLCAYGVATAKVTVDAQWLEQPDPWAWELLCPRPSEERS
ncbi:hypothetical protein V8F33_001979 [Rhypophila sp. PSN 637]